MRYGREMFHGENSAFTENAHFFQVPCTSAESNSVSLQIVALRHLHRSMSNDKLLYNCTKSPIAFSFFLFNSTIAKKRTQVVRRIHKDVQVLNTASGFLFISLRSEKSLAGYDSSDPK